MKTCNVLLISAQNSHIGFILEQSNFFPYICSKYDQSIDRWYMLELTNTHIHGYGQIYENDNVYPSQFQFNNIHTCIYNNKSEV